jgi:hypothetical protein
MGKESEWMKKNEKTKSMIRSCTLSMLMVRTRCTVMNLNMEMRKFSRIIAIRILCRKSPLKMNRPVRTRDSSAQGVVMMMSCMRDILFISSKIGLIWEGRLMNKRKIKMRTEDRRFLIDLL